MAVRHLFTRHAFATTGMAIIAAAALAFTGCSKDETTPVTPNPTSKAGTFIGETKTIGTNGSARSWAVLDSNGVVTSIGLTMNQAALDAYAADNATSMTAFKLPTEATGLAYNHISVDWNPLGHEPAHIYDLPHFDFHFYTITETERHAITGTDSATMYKAPDTMYVPAAYMMGPGTGVPMMGAHWVDLMAPELDPNAHHTFDKTFIYGYYNGSLVFMEPMISMAYLQSKPYVTVPVRLPAKFAKAGYYGTSYGIKYDEAKGEYTISLDGMQKF